MKRTSLQAVAKQALVILAALFAAFIGLMMIASPAPGLTGIGVALLIAGISVVIYFQLYVYMIKWENYRFESILLRWGDRTDEYIILGRDMEDPDNEKLLLEQDVQYFSSIAPSHWLGAPLYWYMWRGVTDDSDEYYVCIGTPTATQNLGEYKRVTVYFRGWFSRLWVRDIEACGVARIDVTEPAKSSLSLYRRIRREADYELEKYYVPVALVTGSAWHAQMLIAAAYGVLPAGARVADTPLLGVTDTDTVVRLREILTAAQSSLVNLWNEDAMKWRSLASEMARLMHRQAPIELQARGFSITEIQPGQPPGPRRRPILLIIGIAATIITAVLLTIYLLGVRV
ncbi:MAG: hypothetical protein QW580_02035 [Nitrososphaerota archaeon]